jgi:hypothetical protein
MNDTRNRKAPRTAGCSACKLAPASRANVE